MKLVSNAKVAYIVTKDAQHAYVDTQTAIAAYADYVGEGYILVEKDCTEINLEGGEYYIEGRGYTIKVHSTGTLNALDRADDAFAGAGTWIVDDGVIVNRDVTHPVNGNRYIVINEGKNYSARRIEITLTNVSLRPGKNPKENDFSEPGMYYMAEYKCDDDLVRSIKSYGVALRADHQPGADIEREDVYYSSMNFQDRYNDETNTVAGNSCVLYNIIKEDAEDNNDRIKTNVYANAYLKINVGNGEEMVFAGADASCSMYDILEYANSNWGAYESQHDVIKGFYSHWNEEGGLELPELKNITAVNAA